MGMEKLLIVLVIFATIATGSIGVDEDFDLPDRTLRNDINLKANVSYSSRYNSLTIKNLTDFTLTFMRTNSKPDEDVAYSTFHLRLLVSLLYELVSEAAGVEITKTKFSNRHRNFVYVLDHLDAVRYLRQTRKSVKISQALFVNARADISDSFRFYLVNFTTPFFQTEQMMTNMVNLWSAIATRQQLAKPFDFTFESAPRKMVAASVAVYSLNLTNVFNRLEVEDFGNGLRRVMVGHGLFEMSQSVRLDFKVLKIPANIPNTTLWILLPSKTRSIEAVQKELKHGDLLNLEFSTVELLVRIPQFDIETHVDKKELQKLGLAKMFSHNDLNINESEDITKDGDDRKVTLDNVVQGIRLQVRALVTKVFETSPPSSTLATFNADRPFMFFLMYDNHRVTRVPLVAGKFHP